MMEVPPAHPCASRPACRRRVGGARTSKGLSFQDPLVTEGFLCLAPVPAGLLVAWGWEGSPLQGPCRISIWLRLAGSLQELPDGGQERREPAYKLLQGLHQDQGLRVSYLMCRWP